MAVTAAALRELHRIHQQLTDLRERLARGPKQIRAREANVASAEAQLAKLQQDLKAARISADQKQLSLKSSEAKIADLKVKLNMAASNREYQALKEQIAASEMAGSVLADEILEVFESIDKMQVQIGDAEQQVKVAKQELEKIKGVVRDQQESINADIRRLEKDLPEAEAVLPSDFREAYERVVRSKGEDAMAQVDGESCGGCYQHITPNMYNDLMMSRAVFCKSCGRLLYLPEDRTPGRTQ